MCLQSGLRIKGQERGPQGVQGRDLSRLCCSVVIGVVIDPHESLLWLQKAFFNQLNQFSEDLRDLTRQKHSARTNVKIYAVGFIESRLL